MQLCISGIDLGAVGRQGEQRHVRWHLKVTSDVPAGAVEQHDAMVVGELGSRMGEEEAHQ